MNAVFGDFNGDGTVDNGGLNALLSNWGFGFAIPEPQALLLALAACVAGGRRRVAVR
ncbi:hypothetical protein [Botrimarina hoheduenensis]|uniref:PEP-CTERM protein-sorting domain-containing protein n=1 Tax=Botrimarina hoheduenensis TaxID=2528000 RepID=A0A5C5VXF7_9BACT|nr:hypothetical protein [Botrimarina hoheduenensis]TWT43296.1 hypothetical protein Pla111_22470 [Botrimarina hoheduenensis]